MERLTPVTMGVLAFLLSMLLALAQGAAPDRSRPTLVPPTGHTNEILDVDVSADGQRFLTASSDHSLILWDRATRRAIRRFEGHTEAVTCVRFHPDGEHCLSGSDDGTIRTWNLATGRQVQRSWRIEPAQSLLGEDRANGIRALSLDISPNGDRILVGTRSGGWLYDASGKPLWPLEFNTGINVGIPIPAIAFSSDGRRILAPTGDVIRLWKVESSKPRRKYEGHDTNITAMAFSPDGDHFASGSEDGEIRLWRIGQEKRIGKLKGHEGSKIHDLSYSRDGRRIVSTATDGTVRVWDSGTREQILISHKIASGAKCVAFLNNDTDCVAGLGRMIYYPTSRESLELWVFPEATTLRPTTFAAVPGAMEVIDGNQDGSLLRWSLWDARALTTYSGHTSNGVEGTLGKWVTSIDFGLDGARFATGSMDGTARLWDSKTGRELGRAAVHKQGVKSVAFDSRNGLLATGSDGGLTLFKVDGGPAERLHRPLLAAPFSYTHAVDISRQGDQVLAGFWDQSGGTRIWKLTGEGASSSGAMGSWVSGHSDHITAAVFDGTGTRTLSGAEDERVILWNSNSGAELGEYACEGPVRSIAVDESGTRAAVAESEAIHVLNLDTMTSIRRWNEPSADFQRAEFAMGDGHVLALGGDGALRVFDLRQGEELFRIIRFQEGGWIVLAPDARFDADQVYRLADLSWVMPDDPLQPLAADMFLRDYFEPGLASKLLGGATLPPVRDLQDLNRALPTAAITGVTFRNTVDSTQVTVDVRVEDGYYAPMTQGSATPTASTVHDLRVYVDGRLAERWPFHSNADEAFGSALDDASLAQWRDRTRIRTGEEGHTTIHLDFPIPVSRPEGPVAISTYAFNADRIKGPTWEAAYNIRQPAQKPRRTAWIVSVGVGDKQAAGLDVFPVLFHAAPAARRMAGHLERLVRSRGVYDDVKVLPLISGLEPRADEDPPTKANIRDLLTRLGPGRRLLRAPKGVAGKARVARPDDLVIFAFSGHGWMDPGGEFYLVPYDAGKHTSMSADLLKRCVSSQELASWLEPIDAANMAVIVDACHSASVVEGRDFKPAPLGNGGFGQLAYDKQVLVLASTQAEDEVEASTEGSMLVQAMGRAIEEDRTKGASVTIGSVLARASELVLELSIEPGDTSASARQQPTLFDFTRE